MKKYTILSIPLSLICILLFIFYVKAQKKINQDSFPVFSVFIDEASAKVLGEVFVLSNPWNDPNELAEFIHDKGDQFNDSSSVIIAMRSLGKWLISNDKNYIEEKCKRHLGSLIKQHNLPDEYSRKIINDFKASNINCNTLGNELLWLAEALPELSRGDLVSYIAEGTNHRSELEKLLNFYASTNISDPEIGEIIMQDHHCHEQELADQICLIALLATI